MPYGTDVIDKDAERDVVYEYEGTFEGFASCVFESFDKKEIPLNIYADSAPASLLYRIKYIETDSEKAGRVLRSIPKRISAEADDMVRSAFLSCWPNKERLMLKFLRLGFKCGYKTTNMLQDETVDELRKAVSQVGGEAHKLRQFIRFTVSGGVLTSIIEPQNFVLPMLKDYFCDRYQNQAFLIYDKTHRAALVYHAYESRIVPVEALTLPDPDPEEENYRELWRAFFNNVAIKERINPRCQMNFMPKKYWKNMTEFQLPWRQRRGSPPLSGALTPGAQNSGRPAEQTPQNAEPLKLD